MWNSCVLMLFCFAVRHDIMHMSMWIPPAPRLTQGILIEKKCLSEFLPYHELLLSQSQRSIFTPFLTSELCQKEILLSYSPVWSDQLESHGWLERGRHDTLWHVHNNHMIMWMIMTCAVSPCAFMMTSGAIMTTKITQISYQFGDLSQNHHRHYYSICHNLSRHNFFI